MLPYLSHSFYFCSFLISFEIAPCPQIILIKTVCGLCLEKCHLMLSSIIKRFQQNLVSVIRNVAFAILPNTNMAIYHDEVTLIIFKSPSTKLYVLALTKSKATLCRLQPNLDWWCILFCQIMWAWTIVPGVLHYSVSSLFYSLFCIWIGHVWSKIISVAPLKKNGKECWFLVLLQASTSYSKVVIKMIKFKDPSWNYEYLMNVYCHGEFHSLQD